jgi:hypothetical protein
MAEIGIRFQANAYGTFASAGLQEQSFLGTGYGAAVPSQGGVEVHWRPPGVGLRNGRILTVFGRMLWAHEYQSAAINPASWQGGAGVRYKPLRSQNLWLNAERLFPIGDAALSSWLFRSMYSLNRGEVPGRVQRVRDYTVVFGDLAYFAARPQTWLFLGTSRFGVSAPLGGSAGLSPHVLLEARYQDRAQQRLGYVQTGAGLALNISLGRDPAEVPRSRVEILGQYRYGGFFYRHPALAPRDTFSGWFLSLAWMR